MSTAHTGNVQPSIDLEEHLSKGNNHVKKVVNYAYDVGADTLSPATPFQPMFTKPYDRMIITYTDSTKDTISTIVTKLAGATQQTVTNTSSATVDDFART